ncbi:MAG: hypothetical protein QOI66_4918 [Myxococcales bacterium]|jgi:hypothetical protein|nr:hypothetical protein [Myxococcales bacterium]
MFAFMAQNEGGGDGGGQSVWHCFPDGVPVERVVVGWRMLLGLPPAALRNLWSLIGAALAEPENPENRQLIEAYAQRYDANAGNILGAVRACDFLLRQGAALNLDEASFRGDLIALSGGAPAGIELIMPRYVEVQQQLRGRMLEDTLADHGNVLLGFDWRVDKVQLSNHGQMDETTVVSLNLRYRSGDKHKRLALQLPPAAMASLKQFWNQFETE